MRKQVLFYIIFVMCAGAMASCSNTRHLAEGQSLFLGSSVSIKDREASKQERNLLKTDLAGAVRPKPNSKTLGMRIKLRLYNFAGEPKKQKGLRAWLRNKVGEPPVLANTFDEERNRKVLTNLLENRGFFRSSVTVSSETKRKKTTAIVTVLTGPQYKIRNVEFIIDSAQVYHDISVYKSNSLLKPGNPYNFEVIKAERERIDKNLKDTGYYYFKPDYLLIQADTSVGNNEVNLYVRLKQDEVPDQAYQQYRIDNVYIYPNFRVNSRSTDTAKNDAVFYKGYYVIDKRNMFKPSVFSRAMQFSPGDLYSRREQDLSLNRLVSLGTFKFVKNRLEPADTAAAMLNAFYYLTPYPKKSVRIEAGALTQNDSRAGSQISISWRNRNTFRGAELFQVKLNGGFEAQYGGVQKQPTTYQAGIETSFSIPRFVIPFASIQTNGAYMPRTFIRAGYALETRNNLFRIHSVKAGYGYEWKENAKKNHQLYPINITYVRTDTLGSTENYNLNYSNLIFNGLIIGPTYEFTFTSQTGIPHLNDFYFDGLADFSGGFKNVDKRANYGDPQDKIFGITYAQYAKLQGDFRHYFNFSPKASLASRLFAGVGMPYGGSSQLPNVKQFFSGGNSSLRGFRSRLVGPGTFNEYYLSGTRKYIELLGDVKMEFNTELRATLYKFLKGAAFFDAGNVWLYNDNPDFPGGKFTTNFYKEYAADMGIGLRFDFSILLLRLDMGMPVRKPWLPEGDRWVFNQIAFSNRDWRRDNLILNIAIGYPF